MFATVARKKHIAKLEKLVSACDTMIVHSNSKVNVFQAVVNSHNQLQGEINQVDVTKYDKEI